MPDIIQRDLIYHCTVCGKEISMPSPEGMVFPPYRVSAHAKDGKMYCGDCARRLK